MGVLQDFERRLEGAVEGFFARAFRSGLQPIELAKAMRRYAEDNQHVTEDGVVVPNVYRVALSPRDLERLDTYGQSLPRELATVVARTAEERGWSLRGPAVVRLVSDEQVRYGTYELAGRVEAVEGGERPPAPPSTDTVAVASVPVGGGTRTRTAAVRVVSGGAVGEEFTLRTGRMVAGRLQDNPVVLDDPTVSREHAAFVRRGDRWWVIDLGSTNGTRVNGVTAAEHPLDDGDRIELGEAALEFVER